MNEVYVPVASTPAIAGGVLLEALRDAADGLLILLSDPAVEVRVVGPAP